MNLLSLLEYEITRNGGIAKVYEMASIELSRFEKDDRYLPLYSRETCRVLNLETGKVYINCSVAARSINKKPSYFQKRIKKFGQYLSFVRVA